MSRAATCWIALVLVAALAACNGNDGGGNGDGDGNGGMTDPPDELIDFITRIEAFGELAELRDTPQPQAEGGPQFQLFGNQSVVNGGTTQIEMAASAQIQRVAAWVEGFDGWYELTNPFPGSSLLMLVTVGQSVPQTSFELTFRVADETGWGESRSIELFVTPVGTGDVQVSLNWGEDADLDLYVVDPFGETIYYGNPLAQSGGVLDLDSNAACDIDGINNENVTWDAGEAPNGQYRVRVNNWDSCGNDPIDWTVTVTRRGDPPLVVTGTATGAGNNGGENAGTNVVTFTFGI